MTETNENSSKNRSIHPLSLIALILSIIALGLILLIGYHAQQLFQKQTQTIQTVFSEQQKSINALTAQYTNTQTTQNIGEALYCLRLANLYATEGHDVNSSLHLLALANQQLANINTAQTDQLKTAIAKDMAYLNGLASNNLTDIFQQFDEIAQALNQLPEHPQTLKRPKTKNTEHLSLLQHLEKLVIIHHHRDMNDFNPEKFIYLREMIGLKLAQAEWAVLHHDNTLYQQSLISAAHWLENYYPTEPKTTALITQLEKLQAIKITPQIDTLESYKLIGKS